MTFLKKLCFIIIGNQFSEKKVSSGKNKEYTDLELVERIVSNNDAMLFGVLYDRYSKLVYNKCLGFAKSNKEAEDLTQDIFLMLYVKLGSFKGNSKFSTWLYSFTYNFCVNYVNRNKERKINDNSVKFETHEDVPVEVTDDLLLEMQVDKLKKALELIAPEDKTILLLKYQDGASIKELEDILELKPSAIKMRLKRAKAKVTEMYKTLN
ncbi:RNA polymerase sigma-70 factor (ECF subfamily) [Maribacter spongiicola]|uniref:RNA polymerase sigma-70 factor (ECF subfamily) n=1 Tax=Maribacter spongiicola TaxID=1206753 RepID=A0A4R7JPJ1_9FLAO|nr:sigma-70 family RNA polymerase sigma factor [Maribacter spongiicola]TDT39536.1 RNA polymerase sigma-70 factor (ECF subfamily) [Maribacter spongiicola]